MIPATRNFIVTENATKTITYKRGGVTTAVGWSAQLDIRKEDDPASTLYLSLLSTGASPAIVLSSDGVELTIAVTISETQLDALVAAMITAQRGTAHYSLKLTKPGGATEQLFKGTVGYVRTATP